MAIGANVVVFGVVNALVLHPLPVPQANRVYSIREKGSRSRTRITRTSAIAIGLSPAFPRFASPAWAWT